MSQRVMRSGVAAMTGPLKLADGTAAIPALSFGSAINTGYFKTATGFGFSVNGVSVLEVASGGLTKGNRFIGELIPITTLAVRPLTVFPFGQTLSRTAYPALWTVAQAEIAAGNTFYNNGDGSTTFGIGDLRGRALFGKDDMGGTAAGRITNAVSGINTQIGSTGGAQAVALLTTNLPPYTPSGSVPINDPGHSHPTQVPALGAGTGSTPNYFFSSSAASNTGNSTTGITASFNGAAQGGTSAVHANMPPGMICNFLLFAGA